MSSTGRGGERVAHDAYETEQRLSRALVGLLPIAPDSSVLEPTAGSGSFIWGLRSLGIPMRIEAVEIRPGCRKLLREAGADGVWMADFSRWTPTDPGCMGFPTRQMEPFDWAVGNLPFKRGIEFVLRAMSFVRPGGHVAFLFREGIMESLDREAFWKKHKPRAIWKIYDRHSFTGSGTDSATYNFFWWTKGWEGTTAHEILFHTKRADKDDTARAAASVLRVPFVGPDQLTLPLTPDLPPIVAVDPHEHIADRFDAFHRVNPAVFRVILQLAREMRKQGWKRGSINMIFERLRWVYALRTRGDTYALNNNYRAFYARVAMAYDHNLDGFFEVRKQLSGEWEPDLVKLGLRR